MDRQINKKSASSIILGILDADILADELQGEYVSYAEMMKRLFRKIDAACQFKIYSAIRGDLPIDPHECDAYLVTGSKSSAYDSDKWIKGLCDCIVTLYQHNKKLLGICFGHQVIAKALGGEVQLADLGWGVGVHTYQVTDLAQEQFDFLPDTLSLIVSHQDQVTTLPNKASLIAHSEFCPHAAYLIQDRVLCFQGHPEFTSEYADALLQKRRDRISPITLTQARQSLNDKTHHLDIARCMLKFAKKPLNKSL